MFVISLLRRHHYRAWGSLSTLHVLMMNAETIVGSTVSGRANAHTDHLCPIGLDHDDVARQQIITLAPAILLQSRSGSILEW
jgi:hypothetical protein